ncbi:ABC transporter permease [Actinoplanes sp. NPDC051343]|uniref:ABC transporter permease n=1 Tax=Actinoplanes sp. NPDC051343 TaxID=3363906 RepID=UPI0037A48F00
MLEQADHLALALAGLRERRMRAALSALGIAVGIATMVVVIGIPAAGQRALMRDLARFGTNLLQVSAMPDQKPPVAFEPQAAAMAARMGPVTGTAAVANTRNPRRRWRRCSRPPRPPRRPARRRRSSGPTPRRRRRPGWRNPG